FGFLIFVNVAALAELFFHIHLEFSSRVNFIGSTLFMILLFVECARTDPSYFGDYPRPKKSYPAFIWLAGLPGALIALLAQPGIFSKTITDLFYCGPRCFLFSISTLLKS